MERKNFLKLLASLSMAGPMMKLKDLQNLSKGLTASDRMPLLFLGHGSPMNAIEENEFVQGFRQIVKTIPTPKAVLCVSAHWETRGTYVTAMENPRTIHDFGGFPRELFEVQYPAPGSPALAAKVKQLIGSTPVGMDQSWGLDHGAWSVIKHLYPNADIPVIQLSLDRSKGPEDHYKLAGELVSLRHKGVLIVGSGNLVHNLGMVAWQHLDDIGYAFDWAEEARTRMNDMILGGDHKSLIRYQKQGRAFDLAIPSPDHFLPLLYVLGLKEGNERVSLFNDRAVAGSLTMTSVKIDG